MTATYAGPVEPPPGSVVTWQTRFEQHGRAYHYAAVHVAGRGWYVTSTQYPSPMTWTALLPLIGPGPCWVATAWAPLPPVIYGQTEPHGVLQAYRGDQ